MIKPNFNSKMVRLKVDIFPGLVYHAPLFQFQNGAIKRARVSIKPTDCSRFQFQNGAIKREDVLPGVAPIKEFQFQNGAIKRQDKQIDRSQRNVFQFQNGAIKSAPIIFTSDVQW